MKNSKPKLEDLPVNDKGEKLGATDITYKIQKAIVDLQNELKKLQENIDERFSNLNTIRTQEYREFSSLQGRVAKLESGESKRLNKIELRLKDLEENKKPWWRF
jgi:hypothetical protein